MFVELHRGIWNSETKEILPLSRVQNRSKVNPCGFVNGERVMGFWKARRLGIILGTFHRGHCHCGCEDWVELLLK